MKPAQQIKSLLPECSVRERRAILRDLRREFPIHPLEAQLNTSAEVILEAIARAGGLTLRMLRGVIGEAVFGVEIVEKLKGWEDTTPDGDLAYDFRLVDAQGEVRVQVKLQRSLAQIPMTWRKTEMFVVETQKTRGGMDRKTGSATRFYRYGEFDILAVSMYPSTGNWDTFRYTVADWLLPLATDPSRLLKLQPVASSPNDDWTDDFATAVQWLRAQQRKTIRSTK